MVAIVLDEAPKQVWQGGRALARDAAMPDHVEPLAAAIWAASPDDVEPRLAAIAGETGATAEMEISDGLDSPATRETPPVSP
jgi:hypothetical protein